MTDLESTSVGPGGEQRDILANVTGLVEDGKLLRLWCTLRDVTQHKREERALRESEAINKAIIQTALDGVVIVDGEGRILEVNDSFCELSGYTRAELVHGLIADFREGVTPEDVRRQLEWVRNQGSWREPGRVRRKDGRVVDVEASIVYQDGSCRRHLPRYSARAGTVREPCRGPRGRSAAPRDCSGSRPCRGDSRPALACGTQATAAPR